jgi:hypothetical protein
MSWSIGGIIVAGATYATNQRTDEWAWRIPLALQWIFPVRFTSPPLNTSIPEYNWLIKSMSRLPS